LNSQSRFANRHNADGTIDSVCIGCLKIVGSVTQETQLATFEGSHACQMTERSLPVSQYGPKTLLENVLSYLDGRQE
jgi:hypothetical protein